ncbi:NAD-P-binding protein [Trametes polyzona]|nr:NAD-P-binding protein [Trametes polyzona]
MTSRPTTWLITGASRGIGLELVRQLLESPSNLVIAACRNLEKATGLNALKDIAKGTLHIIRLDVNDWDNIRALPQQLDPIIAEVGLDYLVNNAAAYTQDTGFTVDLKTLLTIFRVNSIAPALISQIVLPYLEKSNVKKILHVSSTGGSMGAIGNNIPELQQLTAYPMSKSALNMLTCRQKLTRPDITVIALCPGWVKTDMGGANADLEPSESVCGIIKVITSATLADSGKFLRYNGEEIPW